jgi:hypothetical protein
LNLAKKPEWTVKILEANQDAYDYDLHGLNEYLERLETVTAISAKHSLPKHDKMSIASVKSHKRKNGNGHGNGNSESRLFKRTGNSNNNQPFKKNRNVRSVLSVRSFTKENASSKTNLILNPIPKQMVQN